jgi:thioredoxin 1
MPLQPEYRDEMLNREDLVQLPGPVLLEFGANWCGVCAGFAPQVESLLSEYPQIKHIKVQDGRGKPLGRSFRVKLWPTFVFLRDGQVLGQAARPEIDVLRAGLESITHNE